MSALAQVAPTPGYPPASLDEYAQAVASELYALTVELASRIATAGAKAPPQLGQVQQASMVLFHDTRAKLTSGQVGLSDFDKAVKQISSVLETAGADLKAKGLDASGEFLAKVHAAAAHRSDLASALAPGPGIGTLIASTAAVAALAWWGYSKVKGHGGFDDSDPTDPTSGQESDGEEDLGDGDDGDGEAELEGASYSQNPWGDGVERVKPKKPKAKPRKRRKAAPPKEDEKVDGDEDEEEAEDDEGEEREEEKEDEEGD